jgi:hypothetical protein
MKGTTEFEVEIEGQPTVLVVADQRDMARWDVQPFHSDDALFLRIRFLAWSAMRRQGTYTKPFDVFNEKECLYVGAPDDDEESEDEEGLDPGRKAATGAPA